MRRHPSLVTHAATRGFRSVALSHLKVDPSYVEACTFSGAVIRGVKLEAELGSATNTCHGAFGGSIFTKSRRLVRLRHVVEDAVFSCLK